MKQDLATAGEGLWRDLENTVSESRVMTGEVFSPDFCDLREEWKKSESEPLDEVLQHLKDLGYLTIELDPNKHGKPLKPQDEETLSIALLHYYDDQDRFSDWFDYHLSTGESGMPKNVFRDSLLEDRLKQPLVVKFDTLARMRALMTLDGKVAFIREPEIGEISLRTRLLHHLLRLYGVLSVDFKPGTAYGQHTLKALNSLRSLNGLKARDTTTLKLINGLNSFDEVVEIFADQFEGASVSVPAPSGTDWSDSFRSQNAKPKSSLSAKRVVKITAHDTSTPISWPPPDWNVFGIRFLQVFLWHRGHYLGEIDGIWGALSQAAFESALTTHELPVEPMKRWQPEKKKGYWMLHDGFYYFAASAFVRDLVMNDAVETDAAKSPDDIFEIQQAINQQLDELKATDEEQQQTWDKLFAAAEGGLDPKKGRRRRNFSLGIIGRGVRRLVEIVKTAWNSLTEFIKGIVKAISGAVLQAVRFLRRVLAPVLQTARLAARRVIRMFTGAPYVHAVTGDRWVLSKFSFDLDAVTLGSQSLQPEDTLAHFAAIRSENRALDVVITVGVAVLKIVSTFTPPFSAFRYIQLAWSVLKEVWQIFRKLQSGFEDNASVPWRTGMLITT
jgi:hypothetical protein